jgi:hypothetical protein
MQPADGGLHLLVISFQFSGFSEWACFVAALD